MPTITFIEHDGTEHRVDAEIGLSVMRAAIDHLVPGIDADCGGECSCATCHVIVPETWVGAIGDPHGREEEMLDMNPDRHEHSRLACQIDVVDGLDGLVVHMPEFQF